MGLGMAWLRMGKDGEGISGGRMGIKSPISNSSARTCPAHEVEEHGPREGEGRCDLAALMVPSFQALFAMRQVEQAHD
jgi:hypothetical protein